MVHTRCGKTERKTNQLNRNFRSGLRKRKRKNYHENKGVITTSWRVQEIFRKVETQFFVFSISDV